MKLEVGLSGYLLIPLISAAMTDSAAKRGKQKSEVMIAQKNKEDRFLSLSP